MGEGTGKRPNQDDRDAQRFRALLTSKFDMISEVDRQGRVTFVSASHAALHHRDPQELPGSLGFDGVLPEDQPEVAARFANLFRHGESAWATFRVLDEDGEIRWIECTGTAVESADGETRALLLSREVTEQKQIEASLRSSRERFQSIAENAYDMIAEMDAEGRVLFANDQIGRSLGIPGDGEWRQTPSLLLHPEDMDAVTAAYGEAMAGGEPPPTTHRMAHADGSWRWIEARYRRFLNSEGELRIVAIARDLTKSIEAERRRADSEERYRELVESSPLGILVMQGEKVVFSNSAGVEICGADSVGDLLGTAMVDLLEPEAGREIADRLVRIERGEHLPNLTEVRIRGKDGQVRDVIASGTTIRFEGAPAYQGVVQDVTGLRLLEREQNRLQLQLQEARKLESIGMLAGGIAHDFNNLLAVMLSNTRFALRRADDPDLRDALSDAIEAGEQAARLTRQLLAYAGRRSPDVRSADLSEMVRSTSGLLRSAVSSDVELSLCLDPELPTVRADTVQLEQVLMNLVINAADAIGDAPGRVRIATGLRSVEPHDTSDWVGGSELRAGPYAYLEVEDSGPGMDAETCDRIFEPFFTTKRQGHGLGLAAVLGLVRGHEGGVDIRTAPGEGTRFRVYLPAERDEASPASRIGGAVLLVEPDAEQRRHISAALEGRDVATFAAAETREALDLIRRHGAEIDAAICDAGGAPDSLAAALRAEQPGLPLLLTGEAASEALLRRLLNEGPAETLCGPWEATLLVERLASLLGKD